MALLCTRNKIIIFGSFCITIRYNFWATVTACICLDLQSMFGRAVKHTFQTLSSMQRFDATHTHRLNYANINLVKN